MLSSKFGRNTLSDNNASESLCLGWDRGDREGKIIRSNLLETVSNTI